MRRRKQADTPDIPIAPMIDCVFLMLVYFMTTSSLEKSEADLAFPSGRPGVMTDPLPAIDEQTIGLSVSGLVHWNGSVFDVGELQQANSLGSRLAAFHSTCVSAGSKPSVRIEPADEAPHQALITLLDQITTAGIESIHFP